MKVPNIPNKSIRENSLILESVFALLLKMAGLLTSYLFALFVSNRFGAGALGQFFFFLSILSIVSILSKSGVDIAMVKIQASTQDVFIANGRMAIGVLIALLSALVVAITLFGFRTIFLHNLILSDSNAYMFGLAGMAVVPFTLYSIFVEALRGKRQMLVYNIFNQHGAYIYIVSMISLMVIRLMNKTASPVVIYIMVMLLGFLILLFYWVKKYSLRISFDIRKLDIAKEIIGLSLPLMLAAAMNYLLGWIDTLMLGIFWNNEVVGVYNAALRLMEATMIGLVAVNSVIAPLYARHSLHNDTKNLETLAKKSHLLSLIVSLPLMVSIFVFRDFFLNLFGTDFSEGSGILSILVIGYLVNLLSGSVGVLMKMTGHERMYMKILMIAATINVIGNFLLIPAYSMVGAAIATGFSMIFWNIACLIYIKSKTGVWPVATPRFIWGLLKNL